MSTARPSASVSHVSAASQVRPKRFEIDSIHIYRIENGKLAEHWAKRDDLGMAAQLGLLGH